MIAYIETGARTNKGKNETVVKREPQDPIPEEAFELGPDKSEEAGQAQRKGKGFPEGSNCLCKWP